MTRRSMLRHTAVAVVAVPVVLELVPRLIRAHANGMTGRVSFAFDDKIKLREGDIMAGRTRRGDRCISVYRNGELVEVDDQYIKNDREHVRIGEKHYDLNQLELV